MDTKCHNCGEPWNLHHLRHDIGTDAEAADEGYVFHRGCRTVVLRCPCCPRDEGILRAMIKKGES
jgi:hypothetical protein